ncbi:MAG: acyltransferase [Spirochaetales bacterium]|nr:acyltransferase [Spirochaetales bacterium]
MKTSKIVNRLMFDYQNLSHKKIIDLCKKLPNKIIRWIGVHHPDNRIRKVFYQITGIDIGEGTVINQNFLVSDSFKRLLKIGKRVAISPNVTIICDSNPNNSNMQHNKYVKNKLICQKPVVINDDVWIGSNVVILPGVTIGASSIIGAGSVVTKDVKNNTICAGVPAKAIRCLKAGD